MSNALLFDTYAFVKKMRNAGMSEEQAAIHAEALISLIEERLVTKNDMAAMAEGLRKEFLEALTNLENSLRQEIAAIHNRLDRHERLLEDLRKDMVALEISLRKEIDELRKEISELRKDVNELRKEFADHKTEMVRWIISIQLAQLGLMTGIFFAIFRLFGH